MKTLDPLDRLDVAPYQERGVIERAGLTRQQGASAAWLLLPDGTRYRGAAAIWGAIAVALPLLGDLALALYHLPGVRNLQDGVYRWIARNRGRFPGDPPLLPPDDDLE